MSKRMLRQNTGNAQCVSLTLSPLMLSSLPAAAAAKMSVHVPKRKRMRRIMIACSHSGYDVTPQRSSKVPEERSFEEKRGE